MTLRIGNWIFAIFILVQTSGQAAAYGIELSKTKTHYIGCGTTIDIAQYGIEKCYLTILGKFNFYEGKDNTASIRPAVLIDIDHIIFRVPLTFNLLISGGTWGNCRIELFAGGGIGNDYHECNVIYPIISGGMDIYWRSIVFLFPGVNITIKEHDTDTEILLGLGLRL